MTCEKCGAQIEVADWPFCPHGATGAVAVHGDDIPGGMVVENGFDEPIRVYSHSEHRRLLAERGLEIRAKWAGPQDQHLTRWDVPCQYTLEAAKALLMRGSKASTPTRDEAHVDVTITRTTGERFTVGAE